MTISELQRLAFAYRRSALKLVHDAGMGHIGGALSSADILTALYCELLRIDPSHPDEAERDRFILSKGHCVEVYYSILADRGFFPAAELGSFYAFGSRLIGHTNREIPGVEMSTGALGHGLSAACGMALAGKMDKRAYRVFCLLGDGELAEGSVWEAAMFAGNYKLDNLYVAVDRNKLQISGPTEDVMRLEPLEAKFRDFGFDAVTVNGNDMAAVVAAYSDAFRRTGRPKAFIFDTVKGCGVDFMENRAGWHHGTLTDEQLDAALACLNRREKELSL